MNSREDTERSGVGAITLSLATLRDRIEEKLDSFLERLVRVETNQQNARTLVGWVAGIVATLVTTAILWLVALFGGRG